MKVSTLMPQPFRQQLIDASKVRPKNATESSALSKIIDEIRKAAINEHPGLFQTGIETTEPL